MRWFATLVVTLALGVMGCSENPGDAGYVCRDASGEPGAGGGGYYPPEPAGVYSGEVEAIGDQLPVLVRFETSSDCTALVPSTECTLASDNTEPAFFEIEFEGLDGQGEKCGAAIAVTPAMVTEVPIQNPGYHGARFTIDFAGEDGAEWFVDGEWAAPYGVEGSVTRTQGDTYCEGYWFADAGCAF